MKTAGFSTKHISILFEFFLGLLCFAWFFGFMEPPPTLIALPILIDSFFGFVVLALFLLYLLTHITYDVSQNRFGKKDKDYHRKSIVIFLFFFLVFALVSITGDSIFEPIKMMLSMSAYTSAISSINLGFWALFVAVLAKNTIWILPDNASAKTYPKFLTGCIDRFIKTSFLLIGRATLVIIFSAILIKSITLGHFFPGADMVRVVSLIFGIGYMGYAVSLYLRHDVDLGELFSHK